VLGLKLLNRTTREVELTEAGRKLAAPKKNYACRLALLLASASPTFECW